MDEREVKLSAGERFELPDLNGVWGAVTATPRSDERLSTVYLDSEDRRLARWGLSFRYRAGEGWTVKLPTEGSGPLLVRDELVFEGGAIQAGGCSPTSSMTRSRCSTAGAPPAAFASSRWRSPQMRRRGCSRP